MSIEFDSIQKAVISQRENLAKSVTTINQQEIPFYDQLTFPANPVTTETFGEQQVRKIIKEQEEQRQRDIESDNNSKKNKTIFENSGVVELFEEIVNSGLLNNAEVVWGFENHSLSLKYTNQEIAPHTNENGRTNFFKSVTLFALENGTVGEINHTKDNQGKYMVQEVTVNDLPSYITQKIVNDLDN